jgi:lysozyme
MPPAPRSALEALLVLHEGWRRFPYRDTKGLLTIGVGRNLVDRGLDDAEVGYLLNRDIARVAGELAAGWPWAARLDPVRRAVLLELLFNLGLARFRRFAPTLAVIEAGRYAEAAGRLRRAPWYTQVGTRAVRLTAMLETGSWPTDAPRLSSLASLPLLP